MAGLKDIWLVNSTVSKSVLRPHRTVGKPSPYFLAGNSFDAEPPKAFTRAELTALHEKRKAKGESAIRPRTRFVDNEHLITGCFASMVRNANVSPAIEFPD